MTYTWKPYRLACCRLILKCICVYESLFGDVHTQYVMLRQQCGAALRGRAQACGTWSGVASVWLGSRNVSSSILFYFLGAGSALLAMALRVPASSLACPAWPARRVGAAASSSCLPCSLCFHACAPASGRGETLAIASLPRQRRDASGMKEDADWAMITHAFMGGPPPGAAAAAPGRRRRYAARAVERSGTGGGDPPRTKERRGMARTRARAPRCARVRAGRDGL